MRLAPSCVSMTGGDDQVRLMAVGDIFPGDHYFSLGHGVMSRSIAGRVSGMFSAVVPIFGQGDVVLGNLEGPLSGVTAQRSKVQAMAFRGVPEYAETLRAAGFTHLNVANNHIMQHGVDAFEETLCTLRENGIEAIGVAGDNDSCISRPAIVFEKTKRVCLVGYSCVEERYLPGDLRYAYFTNAALVAGEIAWLAKQFDEVIVSCHAGNEGLRIPSPYVISAYRNFIEAGARCVIGHHSHVFQPVELYRGGLISYSLGNFVFDLFWDKDALASAILDVVLNEDTPCFKLHATHFSPDYVVEMMPASMQKPFLHCLRDVGCSLESVTEESYRRALARYEQENQIAKYKYFAKHFFEGKTGLKLAFLFQKFS